MKRKHARRNHSLSFLSLGVLALFFLLALGSDLDEFGIFEQIKEITITYDKEEDKYHLHVIHSDTVYHTMVANGSNVMYHNVFNGPVMFRTGHIDLVTGDTVYYEDLSFYVAGERSGLTNLIGPYGTLTTTSMRGEMQQGMYYLAGFEDQSAFELLKEGFPVYLFSVHAMGIEEGYMEDFMSTLEGLLFDNPSASEDFDGLYEEAMTALSETPFKHVLAANKGLAELKGYFKMKVNEFRLAVIDKSRQEGLSTMEAIQSVYPNYLKQFTDEGIAEQDFEAFCEQFDNTMDGYGPLDKQDPFFADSIDARMFRTLLQMSDESSEKKSTGESVPASDIALTVMYLVFMDFLEGDVLKQHMKMLYMARNEMDTLAWVYTALSEAGGNGSATLEGEIPWDGGAEVTDRGVAWATHFNPTKEDGSLSAGSGIGEFQVTLSGLTEGETYYARSYAVNSTGTAYGNCIWFNTNSTVGVTNRREESFRIYPNPASDRVYILCKAVQEGNPELSIIDQSGRMVKEPVPVSLTGDEFRMEIDISGLQSGMYFIVLKDGTKLIDTQRLVIAR